MTDQTDPVAVVADQYAAAENAAASRHQPSEVPPGANPLNVAAADYETRYAAAEAASRGDNAAKPAPAKAETTQPQQQQQPDIDDDAADAELREQQERHDATLDSEEGGAEFRRRAGAQIERAAAANATALQERFGDRLDDTMRAANRTLTRYGSPRLRAALRASPAIAVPDLIDMLARIDAEKSR